MKLIMTYNTALYAQQKKRGDMVEAFNNGSHVILDKKDNSKNYSILKR